MDPNNLEALHAQIQTLAKNLANPKDKERYLELKEKHYRLFLTKIQKSNNAVVPFPTASFNPYKYYIGRGNNSILVRGALKQRFWWSMGDFDTWEDYHFMWTQWKSNRIINGLKTHKECVKEIEDEKAEKDGLSTAIQTDKDSASSTENLMITTPKRHPQLSLLKMKEKEGSASNSKN